MPLRSASLLPVAPRRRPVHMHRAVSDSQDAADARLPALSNVCGRGFL